MSKEIEYIERLKEAYVKRGFEEKWKSLENVTKSISDYDREELLKEYPDIPKKLLELLEYCDGTDLIYFFGSDVDDGRFPYYLLSSKEMIATKDYPVKYHSYDINREDGGDDFVSEKITRDINDVKWLHFADCINNGGSSRLFIDFTPSNKGKKGQVIRFVHDDDRLDVIADSFDDYLKMLLGDDLPFIYNDDELVKQKNKNIKKESNKNKTDYGSFLLLFFVMAYIIPLCLGFYLIPIIILVIFVLIIIGTCIFGKKDK